MKKIRVLVGKVPPVLVVLGAALVVVAVVAVSHVLRASEVDARVLEESESRRRAAASAARDAEAPREVEDLPAFREAYRVQETSGLALGLSLVAVERRLSAGSPVPEVAGLVEAARAKGLLPPGVSVERAGVLAGPYAVLYIRYRPTPVGVEVVSIPRTSIAEDGAPMMARVTAESGAELFTLLREATPVAVPEPFASESTLEAARWKKELLKEASGQSNPAAELERLSSEVPR